MAGNINDLRQTYGLCKLDTEEYHVFFTKRTLDGQCVIDGNTSLCGAVEKNNIEKNVVGCISKKRMRQEAVEIGDDVCGNCMKSMYKTIE